MKAGNLFYKKSLKRCVPSDWLEEDDYPIKRFKPNSWIEGNQQAGDIGKQNQAEAIV